jgi:glucose-1-phosphate cytidylyltransferase
MTGGRIKRIANFVGDEDFCMTYGDGVGNVDVAKVIEFHKSHGGAATMTSVLPTDRFGVISVGTDGKVDQFVEKPKKSDQFINAGYFVLKPKVFDYITDDMTIWEQDPMRRLAAEGELHAYSHDGFWHAMDTMRDKATLEDMWNSGKAPWKIWED